MTDATTQLSYDDAVNEFVAYLKDYRSFSPLTVRAYGVDLRMLREFLERRLGRVPSPNEIAREMIVQFGVSLKGAAALTLRRKYACISSFFGFLQDMGYATSNPARRLPLPKVSQPVPVCLSEEMAQQLIAAAHVYYAASPAAGTRSGVSGPDRAIGLRSRLPAAPPNPVLFRPPSPSSVPLITGGCTRGGSITLRGLQGH